MPFIQGSVDHMKKKKGQALVEFALMLPIILFLLLGIVDFGRILYAANTINMASQEAVRYSGLGYSDDEVKQFAKDKCALADTDTLMTVDVTPEIIPPAKRPAGTYVTVKISYKVKYLFPLTDVILGPSYDISSQSTIRVE